MKANQKDMENKQRSSIMNHPLLKRARFFVVCICGLFVMLLFTACQGIATTNSANGNQISLTGQIQSVSVPNHSVTLSVGGQTFTVNGLTDAQVTELQKHIGQKYTVNATKNADGSYNIALGSNPVAASDNTPVGVVTPTAVPTSPSDSGN